MWTFSVTLLQHVETLDLYESRASSESTWLNDESSSHAGGRYVLATLLERGFSSYIAVLSMDTGGFFLRK
jgi:hypothetical protein